MKELIEKLLEAIEGAQRACATRQPTEGKDIGYLYGRLQGTHAGLTQALGIVQNFLDDIDQQEEDSNVEYESR